MPLWNNNFQHETREDNILSEVMRNSYGHAESA